MGGYYSLFYKPLCNPIRKQLKQAVDNEILIELQKFMRLQSPLASYIAIMKF